MKLLLVPARATDAEPEANWPSSRLLPFRPCSVTVL
jgi:hypothetical protein